MACDAPANLDAYGADLALTTTDPDPGVLGRDRVRDGKAGAGTHHGVLEEGDVGAGRDATPAEVEEGVGGQLARAVEGEVAAARSGVEGGEVGGGGAGQEGALGGGDVVGLFRFSGGYGGGCGDGGWRGGEVAAADGVGGVAGEG